MIEGDKVRQGSSLFRLESVKKALHPIFVSNEEQEIQQFNDHLGSGHNPNEEKERRLIQALRKHVIRRSADSPDSYYTEDVEKIKTCDWSVVRFIPDDSSECIDKISESIDSSLKWRKEYGIREIQLTSFPAEFFAIGLFELGVNAVTGQPVIYIRGSKYKKISELTEQFERFGSCLYETLDSSPMSGRLTAFLDLKGVSMENVDMPTFRHFLDLMFNFFPNILHEAYVVDVSWFIRPIVFLLLKVIPERFTKNVRIVTSKELVQADPSSVPQELGGLLQTQPLQVRDPVISLQEFVLLHNIPQSVVAKAKKIYKLQ